MTPLSSKPRAVGQSQRALGKTIRAARERKGYSQESFARHIAMDRSAYGAVERGKANYRLGTLKRIAAGLDSSLGELCTKAKI
jgi:transcriptional regulator with XRE-family HTH domain